MGDLTKDFSRKEFCCKCGRKKCDAASLDMRLVSGLQSLRDLIGTPLYITSAVRCRWHNNKIGGAAKSKHLLGQAADIQSRELLPKELARFAEQIPAFEKGGIGVYKSWVHVDVRGHRARWNG
ncbi:MAG: D-Ala-D-Ala carboxypeptidase family metallohydrolase [Tannerellaceae bacterium]